MRRKVLLIATVQSHIGQFHKPLMQLLKENGWEIHVAARDNLAEKNGLELEYPDKVFDVPFQRSPLDKRNIDAYKMLKRILQENHYDVIHCNTPVGGMLGRIAGQKYRKSGTKVYYTAHGFHFYKGAPLLNWVLFYPLEREMSRFTDKLITIAEQDYKLASDSFHCPVYHIHGVGSNSRKYHRISESEQETEKKKLGFEGQIIVNAGELLHNKNQKAAIRAMSLITKSYPNARLYIAGNGPERENLEEQVRQLGLEKHIFFLGYTTNLQKYLQICDVEIACSYREGLPLNIMEAMLCGKAVVASHNRGHDELVEDGKTGFLVSPDDVEGYAQAVCRVLEDPSVYAEAAIQRVEVYTDVFVRKELAEIYEI